MNDPYLIKIVARQQHEDYVRAAQRAVAPGVLLLTMVDNSPSLRAA